MLQNKVRHLVVVNGSKTTGIITSSNFINYLNGQLDLNDVNARILEHYQKNQLNLNLLMHKTLGQDSRKLHSKNSIDLNRYENCEKWELLLDKINLKTRGGWILKY